jgi:hypothetical protein
MLLEKKLNSQKIEQKMATTATANNYDATLEKAKQIHSVCCILHLSLIGPITQITFRRS